MLAYCESVIRSFTARRLKGDVAFSFLETSAILLDSNMLFYRLGNVSEVCKRRVVLYNVSCNGVPRITASRRNLSFSADLSNFSGHGLQGVRLPDIASSSVSILNVIINMFCLLIFYFIWRENKRSSIHVALLYLSVCEMFYQFVTAIRHVTTTAGLTLNSSALMLDLECCRRLLELVLYASRNWWLAIIACCRAYFVSSSPSSGDRWQFNLRNGGILICGVVCIAMSYVFGTHFMVLRPEAAACVSSDTSLMTADAASVNQAEWWYRQAAPPDTGHVISIVFAFIFILIPFVSITVSSMLIWRTIVKNAYGGGQRYVRVAVLICAITTVFLVLEGPGFFIASVIPVLHFFRLHCLNVRFMKIDVIADVLGNLNSLTNAFIYLCADNIFRGRLFRMIRGRQMYAVVIMNELSTRQKDHTIDTNAHVPPHMTPARETPL